MSIIVFKNCSVFDGHTPELLEGVNVVVADGKIQEITKQAKTFDGATVIDIGGKTLMLGLIDAHVHVYAHEANLSHNDDTPIEHRALYAKAFMEAALNRGFTTLRDAGELDIIYRELLKKG